MAARARLPAVALAHAAGQALHGASCWLRHAASAERVKDLASVAGVRVNQLVGYGLVVGLDGTGDQTSQAPFTVQSLKNMLAQLGVTRAGQRQPAAEERRRRDRAGRAAAVREAGPDDRRHGLVDRQRARACAAAAC